MGAYCQDGTGNEVKCNNCIIINNNEINNSNQITSAGKENSQLVTASGTGFTLKLGTDDKCQGIETIKYWAVFNKGKRNQMQTKIGTTRQFHTIKIRRFREIKLTQYTMTTLYRFKCKDDYQSFTEPSLKIYSGTYKNGVYNSNNQVRYLYGYVKNLYYKNGTLLGTYQTINSYSKTYANNWLKKKKNYARVAGKNFVYQYI